MACAAGWPGVVPLGSVKMREVFELRARVSELEAALNRSLQHATRIEAARGAVHVMQVVPHEIQTGGTNNLQLSNLQQQYTQQHPPSDVALLAAPLAVSAVLQEQNASLVELQTEVRKAQDLVAVRTSEALALHSHIDLLEADLIQGRSYINEQNNRLQAAEQHPGAHAGALAETAKLGQLEGALNASQNELATTRQRITELEGALLESQGHAESTHNKVRPVVIVWMSTVAS